MIRAYDELVDFIAAGTTPDAVAAYEASQATRDYVSELIHKEKTVGLSPEETSELDHFVKLEHLMRLAKARARANCRQCPATSARTSAAWSWRGRKGVVSTASSTISRIRPTASPHHGLTPVADTCRRIRG
jgi:hypothetical protein